MVVAEREQCASPMQYCLCCVLGVEGFPREVAEERGASPASNDQVMVFCPDVAGVMDSCGAEGASHVPTARRGVQMV